MSLRLRLTLWHSALLGLVLVALAALVDVAVERQLASQLDYAIHLQALDASRMVHTVSRESPGVRRLELDPGRAAGDRRFYIQIVDPNGGILASLGTPSQPLPMPETSVRSALDGRETHMTLNLPNEQVELYSAPLLLDGTFVGVLQVGASRQPVEASRAQARLVLGLVVIGAITLSAVASWSLASKALRPVDRLTREASSIGRSDDLTRRLAEPPRRDEIGRLAATFNDMLARLEQTVANQRRFLADASHELRTPLTAIRTNLAGLLRGVAADPAEREAALKDIAREADRMGRLVADLLALARVDAGQPLGRHPLALDTLLLEVYQQEKALADGVKLTLGELEQVEVEADPDRLKQLILNLVDNALRYTPAGGDVTLDLIRRDAWAVLRVADTGPGIPDEHLPRIFDRFYRVDQPRSRAVGGTGLGLAIARWVAEAHGGRIEVESGEATGSTFTVLLPAREPVGESVGGSHGATPSRASQQPTVGPVRSR